MFVRVSIAGIILAVRTLAPRRRLHWMAKRCAVCGTPLQCNGDTGPAEVRRYCVIDDANRSLLRAAMQQMS
jgi:hypothetical protein